MTNDNRPTRTPLNRGPSQHDPDDALTTAAGCVKWFIWAIMFGALVGTVWGGAYLLTR